MWLCLWLALTPADAGKKKQVRDAVHGAAGPAASAAEIPALSKLLDKAHWTPTPEMSGVFQAGRVFTETDGTHTVLSSTCFDVTPQTSTYTASEVISKLQAGVSVGLGAGRVDLKGALVKKVKFGAPTHTTIDRLGLTPTHACAAQLAMLPPETMAASYVVQEVLEAEITDQTCGQIDASGRFVVVGEASTEFARACSVRSLEPVSVGYRTIPLSEIVAPLGGPADSPFGEATSSIGTGGTDFARLAREAALAEEQAAAAERARREAEQRRREAEAALDAERERQLDELAVSVRAAASRDYEAIAAAVSSPSPQSASVLAAYLE